MSARGEPRVVLLLADGARPDVMEELCARGDLPHVARHVLEAGTARRAVTVFPSTTGPAHLPYLTGLYPGSCDIPGIRWFDPDAFEAKRLSVDRCRSYVGPGVYLLDRDLRPDVRSLFHYVHDHANVFGNCTRDLRWDRHLTRFTKLRLNVLSFFSTQYGLTDRECGALVAEAAERRLVFAVVPGIDSESHKRGVRAPETFEAYRRLDHAVGLIAARLGAGRLREEVLLLIVSDHGLTDTARHFDLEEWLAPRRGPVLAYPRLRGLWGAARSACMVSGNAMAHVHTRGPEGWGDEGAAREIGEALVDEAAIDVVAWRERGGVIARSARGEARIETLERDRVSYEPLRGDPFGYASLPRSMTDRDALDRTIDLAYPDAIVQLAQIFRSRRAGDLVVTAAPGWDLRARFERPQHAASHGALYAEHMRVPLWSNRKLGDGPIRSVDVFCAILKRLGVAAAPATDGVAFEIE